MLFNCRVFRNALLPVTPGPDPESSLVRHSGRSTAETRNPARNLKLQTSNLQYWIPDNLAPGGDFRNDGEGATVSGMTV